MASFLSTRPLMRVMLVLLTWKMMGEQYDVASLVMWSPRSVTSAVAHLSGYPRFIAYAYFSCLVMLVPYFVTTLLATESYRRLVAKLAALGSGITSALYTIQVAISHNADLPVIQMLYMRTAIEFMVFAFVLGYALNAEVRAAARLEAFAPDSSRVDLYETPKGL